MWRIRYSLLHRWRKESDAYDKNSFPGRGKPKLTDEQKEIAALRKQLKGVSLENEILKKGEYILQEGQVKFRFIEHHKFKFSVKRMCKTLRVSKSGYCMSS